jgi:hypothetical protein
MGETLSPPFDRLFPRPSGAKGGCPEPCEVQDSHAPYVVHGGFSSLLGGHVSEKIHHPV